MQWQGCSEIASKTRPAAVNRLYYRHWRKPEYLLDSTIAEGDFGFSSEPAQKNEC